MVNHRRRGHVLMVAVIVMLVVASAVALIWGHYRLQMQLAIRQTRQVRLVALNDAAVAEALARLAQNPAFRGEASHAFGAGQISSEIRSLDDNRREILAAAKIGGWSRRTRLEVTLVANGPRVDTWSIYRGGD